MENNFITERADLENNLIFEGYGGAIFSGNSNVVLDSTTLQKNKVTTGATAIFNNCNLITNNCDINSNKAECDNIIQNNVNAVGTLLNSENSSAILIKTSITNNQVKYEGGGIYNKGDLVLLYDKITHNKVLDTENKPSGGGIFSTTNFIASNTLVKSNKPDNVVIKE